jgi:hypothetical protein
MGCRRKVLSGVGVGGKDIVAGWLVSNTCRSFQLSLDNCVRHVATNKRHVQHRLLLSQAAYLSRAAD